MSARKNPYARPGLMSMPVILIVGFAVGLWLFWPRGGAATTGPRRSLSRMSVAYAGSVARDSVTCADALLFMGPPPRRGSMPPDDDLDVPRVAPAAGGVALLKRDAPPLARLPLNDATLALDGFRPESAYRPPWPEKRAFTKQTPGAMKLLVETSGAMRQYGFEPADIPAANLEASGKTWQATLYVQCGPDGKAEEVFIERRTDDPAIDAALVRACAAGRLLQAGTACGGRVTVSYGME